MGYVEQNLTTGETVLYQTRLHWIYLSVPVVVGALIAIPGLFLFVGALVLSGHKSGSDGLGLFGFLAIALAAAIIGLAVLSRNAVEMAVTNKRVIIKAGLISKKTHELFLHKIENVGVDQGILGRMLGYGTVVVRGTGGTHEPFNKVAAPLEFRRQVQHQMEQAHQPQQPASV